MSLYDHSVELLIEVHIELLLKKMKTIFQKRLQQETHFYERRKELSKGWSPKLTTLSKHKTTIKHNQVKDWIATRQV
jgi:hypothetical protein